MKTVREIRLRSVPIEVIAAAKSNAMLQGKTMEAYIIEVLTKALTSGKKR